MIELERIGVPLRSRDTVIGVDDSGESLRGISRAGTFVQIIGHPNRIPEQIWRTLDEGGWDVISFDDSRARRVYLRDHG